MDRTGKIGTPLASPATVHTQIAAALKECGINEGSIVYKSILEVAPILEAVVLGFHAENGQDLLSLAHACSLPLFADPAIKEHPDEMVNLTNAYLGSHFLAYSFVEKDALELKGQVLEIWTGVLTVIYQTVRSVNWIISAELYISPDQRLGPAIGNWPGLGALRANYPFGALGSKLRPRRPFATDVPPSAFGLYQMISHKPEITKEHAEATGNETNAEEEEIQYPEL